MAAQLLREVPKTALPNGKSRCENRDHRLSGVALTSQRRPGAMPRKAANSREEKSHQILEPPERPAKPAWVSASEAIRKAAALEKSGRCTKTRRRKPRGAASRVRARTADGRRKGRQASFEFPAAKSVCDRHRRGRVLGDRVAGYLYWDNAGHFEIDRRRLHRRAPVSDRAEGVRLHHRRASHRQPARRRRRCDRAHRRSRLPHRTRSGRGAGGQRRGQHPATSMRRSPSSRHRSSASQAQVEQAQAGAGIRRSSRRPVTGPGAEGRGTVQNAQQYSSQLHQQQARRRDRAGER